MVDKRIEDAIRFYIQQGYTKQQIVDYLVSFGYVPNDVRETYDFVENNPVHEAAEEKTEGEMPAEAPPKESPIKPKDYRKLWITLGAVGGILLIIFAGIGIWYAVRPVCGDGKVGGDETMQTCCEDTGCLGEQDCVNHACVEPKCGYCEYLENHACLSWQCCENKDCMDEEFCDSHECKPLECLECQYILDHACNFYDCCKDSDCGSGFTCVDNECIEECGECQYSVDNLCVDYECCSDDVCVDDMRCQDNFCVPVVCSAGETVIGHKCISAERCDSNENCNDNDTETLDLCIGAGSDTSHCLSVEADQCDNDAQCDDNEISTEDRCVGSPQHCIYEKLDCDEFGELCLDSEGTCDGDIHIADDTAYCCVGTCERAYDLFIDSMDEDDGVVEVEIRGHNRLNETITFTIYAFENSTQMDTSDGLEYATINGGNDTDTFYFNITAFNATINVTAVVDYDDDVDEINETNNNMTILVTI